MWATAINTPTFWCSDTPANCSETMKRLFTTNMENILYHGWGTRASWLIGRLNKLRPKRYANHLSCSLASFKIQGNAWRSFWQKLGKTCNCRQMFYFLPANLSWDVLYWQNIVFEVFRITCEDANHSQSPLTSAIILGCQCNVNAQFIRHPTLNYCILAQQYWHEGGVWCLIYTSVKTLNKTWNVIAELLCLTALVWARYTM